jgi:hypothetical protein
MKSFGKMKPFGTPSPVALDVIAAGEAETAINARRAYDVQAKGGGSIMSPPPPVPTAAQRAATTTTANGAAQGVAPSVVAAIDVRPSMGPKRAVK